MDHTHIFADVQMTALFKNGLFFDGRHGQHFGSLFVKEGRIDRFVKGDESDIESDTEPNTIDLEGRLVLPAFVDAHCHLLQLGESLNKVDLQGCRSLSDILFRLRQHIDRSPLTDCIVARNWMPDMTEPHELDRESFDSIQVPIILESFDLHSSLCNTAALHLLSVNDQTKAPAGGTFVRDNFGRLTGWMQEMAHFEIVARFLQQRSSHEEKKKSLKASFDALLSAGYTGVGDLLMEEEVFRLIEEQLQRDGSLPLRVRAYWHVPPRDNLQASMDFISKAKEYSKKWEANEWLQVVGVKFVTDGVIDSCTAALFEPYQDGSNAEPIWPLEQLKAVVKRADEADLQCAIHAIGDLAVSNAVQSISALGSRSIEEKRHRIEHLELTREEDVKIMGRNGITASVQPVHSDPAIAANWYKQLGGQLGTDHGSGHRCDRAFAYKDFLEAGAPVAIGTDSPTADFLPFPNLHIATTRTSAQLLDLNTIPDLKYAFPMVEAICSATSGAARACHLEGHLGSFEVGTSADFNVLNTNLFSSENKNEIFLRAQILVTYRKGKLVVKNGVLE